MLKIMKHTDQSITHTKQKTKNLPLCYKHPLCLSLTVSHSLSLLHPPIHPPTHPPTHPHNTIAAIGSFRWYVTVVTLSLAYARVWSTSRSRMLAYPIGVCIRPRLAACIKKVYTLTLNVGICASHNVACSVVARKKKGNRLWNLLWKSVDGWTVCWCNVNDAVTSVFSRTLWDLR
jgi:hypothetical protein